MDRLNVLSSNCIYSVILLGICLTVSNLSVSNLSVSNLSICLTVLLNKKKYIYQASALASGYLNRP